jgi:hypothetical protein
MTAAVRPFGHETCIQFVLIFTDRMAHAVADDTISFDPVDIETAVQPSIGTFTVINCNPKTNEKN